MVHTKSDIINSLRKEMLSLSGLRSPVQEEPSKTGLQFMQEHFPFGVFPKGAIHEFVGATPEAITATGGFVSAMISTVFSPSAKMIWISESQNIFPPALKLFHNDPSQIIFIHPTNKKECLWVIEETLKCSSIKIVIAELPQLSFVHSRRLQLAVEKSNVTGFILKTF